MNNRTLKLPFRNALAALTLLLFVSLTLTSTHAQSPAGGTEIKNQASARYSDGSVEYTTTSNIVTVTVANVSGLSISPDDTTGVSVPAVVSGETNVDFNFTVTNSGNFDTQVRFLASGQSVRIFGPGTIQGAVIDIGPAGYDAGDTNIWTNAADVLSATVARGSSFNVIVRVNINAAAVANDVVNVRLGDAGGDNQVADSSAREVRTSSGGAATPPVNGESEALGDSSARVENDAQLQLGMTVPAGPVALGSNITYSLTLQNVGARAANTQTMAGAPAGSNTGVYVVVPIPSGTVLQSVPAPPAGVTVLYSTTSPLGADPVPGADPPASGPLSNAVVWTTAPPGVLSSTTRVAFRVNNGAALPVAANIPNLDLVLTVQTGINASVPIYGIGEAFGRNRVSSPITDQSGDAVSNKGDGNANFNEPKRGVAPNPDEAVSATQGYQQPTSLVLAGSVLVGPSGFPDAVGPTSNNDDYTNKTVSPLIVANLGFGDSTGSATSVDFTNTVRNTGNGDDVFTLTAPTIPATFGVAVSTDGGTNFVPLTGGGSTTLAVSFGQQANVIVRVTAPAGTAVLNGFATVLRATSANSPASSNDTVDRLYTGFLRLTKTATVINNTTVGNGQDDPGPDDAVPGAMIEYVIRYENISNSGDPLNPTAGTNCVQLTASSIVITENGNGVAPTSQNNWGATTTQVVGSAIDSIYGTLFITGDTAGSSVLTDSIATLAPGQWGTFTFRRLIN